MKRTPIPGEIVTPLKRARESRNLSSVALARDAGINLSTWNRVERGLQAPRPSVAERMLAALRSASLAGGHPEPKLTEVHLIYPRRFVGQQHRVR